MIASYAGKAAILLLRNANFVTNKKKFENYIVTLVIQGVPRSTIIDKKTTLLLFELKVSPHWFRSSQEGWDARHSVCLRLWSFLIQKSKCWLYNTMWTFVRFWTHIYWRILVRVTYGVIILEWPYFGPFRNNMCKYFKQNCYFYYIMDLYYNSKQYWQRIQSGRLMHRLILCQNYMMFLWVL